MKAETTLRPDAKIEAGDVITFDVVKDSRDPECKPQEFSGTVLIPEVNGFLLIAVHKSFYSSGNGYVLDASLAPACAVRRDAVRAVRKTGNQYQGTTPEPKALKETPRG